MDSNEWLELSANPAEDERPVVVWHVFQGVMVVRAANLRKNRFNTYWMEVPDGWIDPNDRLPTREDADTQNCVIVRTTHGDVTVRGWHQVGQNGEIVQWMRPPKPPDNYRELRMNAD